MNSENKIFNRRFVLFTLVKKYPTLGVKMKSQWSRAWKPGVESGWSGFFGQKKVFLELFGSQVQEVASNQLQKSVFEVLRSLLIQCLGKIKFFCNFAILQIRDTCDKPSIAVKILENQLILCEIVNSLIKIFQFKLNEFYVLFIENYKCMTMFLFWNQQK